MYNKTALTSSVPLSHENQKESRTQYHSAKHLPNDAYEYLLRKTPSSSHHQQD